VNHTVPGLVDLQVNGALGHDLTSDPERLWDVAAALPAYGVTAFLPTVITADPTTPARALQVLAAGPPAGWRGAEPLGLHVEGPMLAPARRGAHPAEWLRDPSLELAAGWSREAGVAMVTIAPELPGALEVIAALAERGVVVSLGHTEAGSAEVAAAVAAGARCVTHLGNAMPPLRAREPGLVGAALGGLAPDGPELVAGLVVDGHHLAPELVRTAWRALGPARFLSVSDTTAALGLPDGATRLGDQDVVLADGAVRLRDGTLAGSAASLLDCLRVLVATVGCSVEEAVATATSTPLRLLGLDARSETITLTDDLRLPP
jgi:N-acetylglucosamine-6-phosphate deacetylase